MNARWRGVINLCIGILGVLIWLCTPWATRTLLPLAQTADIAWKAEQLDGTLWHPKLRNVYVWSDGIWVFAQNAEFNLDILPLLSKKLSFSAKLANSTTRIDPEAWPKTSNESKPNSWQIQPHNIDVQNVQLAWPQHRTALPNGRLYLTQLTEQQAKIQLQAPDGQADIQAHYQLNPPKVQVQFQADATLLNHWWDGVRGGRLQGQYHWQAKTGLNGQIQVQDALVQVPNMRVARLRNISGTIRQKNMLLRANLKAQAHQGPVQLQATADIAQKRWSFDSQLNPDLASVALGVGINQVSGRAQLSLQGWGWTTAHIQAKVRAQGQWAGVRIPQINAQYQLNGSDSALQAQIASQMGSENQRLQLSFQQLAGAWQGYSTLSGQWQKQPVAINIKLQQGVLDAEGLLLGGQSQLRYRLSSGAVSGRLQLTAAQASLSGLVTGRLNGKTRYVKLEPLNIRLPSSWPQPKLTGFARWSPQGSSLDLGVLRAELPTRGRGSWAIDAFQLPAQVTLLGAGSLSLSDMKLAGQLTVRQPQLPTLSGTIGLTQHSDGQMRAYWNTPYAKINWQNATVAVKLQQFPLLGTQSSGTVRYSLPTAQQPLGQASGQWLSSGPQIRLNWQAQQQRLRLNGQIRDVVLAAEGNWQTLQAQVQAHLRQNPQALRIQARYQTANPNRLPTAQITANVYSRQQHLAASWNAQQGIRAQGQLDLSVAQYFQLPLRGLLKVKAQQKTAQLQLSQGAWAQWPLAGSWQLDNGALKGQLQSSLSLAKMGSSTVWVKGLFYPQLQLNVQADTRINQQKNTLMASIFGPYNQLRWQADGSTPKLYTHLAGRDLGVASSNLKFTGTLTPQLTATGAWGDLQLAWRDGRLKALGRAPLMYRSQAVSNRVNLSWSPTWQGDLRAQLYYPEGQVQLNGAWRNLRLTANYQAPRGSHDPSGQILGFLDASRQRFNVQASARGWGYQWHGHLKGVPQDWQARVRSQDPQTGRAEIQLRSQQQQLRAQAWLKQFHWSSGVVSGALKLNPQLQLSGKLAGSWQNYPIWLQLSTEKGLNWLSGRGRIDQSLWQLRSQLNLSQQSLTQLQVQAQHPLGKLQLQGAWQNGIGTLSGSLSNVAQRLEPAQGISLALPAQKMLLQAYYSPQNRWLRAQDAWGQRLSWSPKGIQGQISLQGLWNQQVQRLTLAYLGQQPHRVWQLSAQGWLHGQLYSSQDAQTINGALRISGQAAKTWWPQQLPWSDRAQLHIGLTGSPQELHVANRLEGVQYLGRAVNWSGHGYYRAATTSTAADWRWWGSIEHPLLYMPIQISPQGLNVLSSTLDAQLARPWLPDTLKDYRGQLQFRAQWPQFDRKKLWAQLNTHLSGPKTWFKGDLLWQHQQLSGQIRGLIDHKPVYVGGQFYPQANAMVRIDRAQGHWRGQAQQAQLALQGHILQQPIEAALDWQAPKAHFRLDSATNSLEMRATRQKNGRWQAQLQASLANLSNFGLSDGRAELSANWLETRAVGVLKANYAQHQLDAPWQWFNGRMWLSQANIQGPVLRGTVGGQILPTLQLAGAGGVLGSQPSRWRLDHSSGQWSDPQLKLSGVWGLGLVGTTGEAWQLNYAKKQLMVSFLGRAIRGNLTAHAQQKWQPRGTLQLNVPIATSAGTIQVKGELRSHQSISGDLVASGMFQKRLLTLELHGRHLSGRWGFGRMSGVLGDQLWQQPQAKLALERIDLGRLWGKPQQLYSDAQLTIGGTWAQPYADVRGQLADSNQQLSGGLSGFLSPNRAWVYLQGQRLQAQFNWNKGIVWSGRFQALSLRVANLLPEAWGISDVTLSGRGRASPLGVDVVGLKASLVSQSIGAAQLSGNVHINAKGVGGRASVHALGGSVQLTGSLPTGMQLDVQDVQLPQALGRLAGQLTLSGAIKRPQLGGRLQWQHPQANNVLTVTGSLQDPALEVKTSLHNGLAGELVTLVRDIQWGTQQAHVSLKGWAQQGQSRLDANISGKYPQLVGDLKLQDPRLPQDVRLIALGDGRMQVQGGNLASGQLFVGLGGLTSGQLSINPLAFVAGAKGEGHVGLVWSGNIQQPRWALSARLPKLDLAGVKLRHLEAIGQGRGATGTLDIWQQGRLLGQLTPQKVRLQNLDSQVLGQALRWSGHWNQVNHRQELQLSSSGSAELQLQLSYNPQASEQQNNVDSQYQLKYQGYLLKGKLSGSQQNGWIGDALVSGLPQWLSPKALNVRVDGDWSQPKLSAKGDVLGAWLELEATSQQSSLSLSNGSAAQASGRWLLSDGQWQGDLNYRRLGVQSRWNISGASSSPTLRSLGQRGRLKWDAVANTSGGTLSLSEGGYLRWRGQQLESHIQNLPLEALALKGLSGLLSVQQTELADTTGQGQIGQIGQVLQLKLQDLRSPWRIPALDIDVAGNLDARLQLTQNGHLTLNYQQPQANIVLDLSQQQQNWQGNGQVHINSPHGGTLTGNFQLYPGQLYGQLKAQDLGWEYSNTPGTFSGDVQLQGQTFALKGQVLSSGGQLNLSGDGAIGDLSSSLQGLGFAASEDGYRIQARLNALQLRDLRLARVNIPPYLEGTLSGQAVFTSGVSNFNLRAEPLTLAGESLISRLSGTTQNGNWRLSGLLGSSSLSGQIDNGLLQVRLDAVGAPIHALLASYSGPLPAKATYTGLVQYKGPLGNWNQGQLDAVAERMVISGRGQRLSGTGVLQYRKGTFTISDTEFHGAGDWVASGVYTQDKVSLNASTRNAKFTPILLLIPQLKPLKPALEGNVDVQISGNLENPFIEVNGSQLRGQMSGLDFKLSRMNARYYQKQWQFDAPISSSGSIALDGQVHAQGYFTPENSLQNSFITLKGKGNIENIGALSSISAEIRQTGARWLLVSRAKQGGTLDLDGELYPQMLLRFSAKDLNPVIPALYVKSSQLSATGQLEARGSEYWLSGLASFPVLNIGSMPKSKTSPKITPDPEASFISPLPDRLSTFEGQPNTGSKGNSFLQHLHFDQVLINARNGIKFDESIARAELGGFLTLNGTAADPQVSGLIRPISGSVFLRENEFVIDTKRSTINFDPANGAFPTLAIFANGQVNTNTETLKVTVEVRGTVQTLNNGKPTLNIETRLSSVPPRDETTLYGLVALGELQADAITQSALRTALNVLILGEVERSVAKALGVNVVKVNSNWLDGGSNLTADFTIGQYITKNVYVQYNIDLSGHSLIDARYTTSDGKFNFSVSTPIKGLDFNDLHPSFSLGYNFNDESSVNFGIESGKANVFKLAYELRW